MKLTPDIAGIVTNRFVGVRAEVGMMDRKVGSIFAIIVEKKLKTTNMLEIVR